MTQAERITLLEHEVSELQELTVLLQECVKDLACMQTTPMGSRKPGAVQMLDKLNSFETKKGEESHENDDADPDAGDVL